jgi:hypothetical protein
MKRNATTLFITALLFASGLANADSNIKLDATESAAFRDSFQKCSPANLAALKPKLSAAGLVFAPQPAKIAPQIERFAPQMIFKTDAQDTIMIDEESGDTYSGVQIMNRNDVLLNYAMRKYTNRVIELDDGTQITGLRVAIYQKPNNLDYSIYFDDQKYAKTFASKVKLNAKKITSDGNTFTVTCTAK